MNPVTVTASALSQGVHLSHIACPVGPECFYPHRRFADEIVRDASTYASAYSKTDYSIVNQVYDQIKFWYSSPSYQCPPKPEEHFTRTNLGLIFEQIISSIEDHSKFSLHDSNQVSNHMLFKFSRPTSLPEPVIFYRYDSVFCPLVASEAKSLNSSLYVSYSQAISLASDVALKILDIFPELKYDDVVVPFIMTSWDHFQIGFVYLVKDNYPCASIISNVLSLSNESHLLELCSWIVAIGNHCKRFINYAINLPLQPQNAKKLKLKPSSMEKENELAAFLSSSYIFKPINCNNEQFCRSTLSQLLNKFYRLWKVESLRDIVVFPSGVIGLPDKLSQQTLYDGVFESYMYLFVTLKGGTTKQDCKITFQGEFATGHPIILYDNIVLQESADGDWKRGDLLQSESKDVKEAFIRRLKEVTELIEQADIIHLDLRVYNIFYKYSYDSSMESKVSSSLSLLKVHIKIIDWDDCDIIGRNIKNKGKDDVRFPYSEKATKEIHSFFIDQIKRFLEE